MVLNVLRGLFVLLAIAVATLFAVTNREQFAAPFAVSITVILLTMLVALAVVWVDFKTRQKKLAAISGVFLGLVTGLLVAYAFSFVVDLIGVLYLADSPVAEQVLQAVKVLIGLITCYLGISFVLQTRDDFRFVIPYVELAKEIRGSRPTLLDTSVIVDGRILDIIETRVMQGRLVVPRFVLHELQTIADSSDKLRRTRGRRGLDILKKLQESELIEVVIEDADAEGADVDQKLIALGQRMQGRVMTTDYNLNKMAQLRGVEVININDLAKAMRPVVLPGEHMQVKIIKPGESADQGVGYLEDGTMVVVERGRRHIGEQADLTVTSTLQTSAGRMIFGRFEHESAREKPADHEDQPTPGANPLPPTESGGDRDNPAEATLPTPTESGGAPSSQGSSRPRRASPAGRNPRRSR